MNALTSSQKTSITSVYKPLILKEAHLKKAFTLSISNNNDPVTDITLSDSTIGENQNASTTIGTFTSSDQDTGDTHSYTFDNINQLGTDNDAFILEGNTLKSKQSFDFEVQKEYNIQVKSSDGQGSEFIKQFSIYISDANDAPTAVLISTDSIAENMPSGTFVGIFSTSDQDTSDTHDYTFVNTGNTNDNGSFSIQNGNELFTNERFNYELKDSYTITVKSTDASGASISQNLTIRIIDQNDSPSSLSLSTQSIGENLPLSTFLGKLSTTDEDLNESFHYDLTAGLGDSDNGSFLIRNDSLLTNEVFDFEDKANYTIRISARDSAGERIEKAFTITVNNLNDTTTDLVLSTASIEENRLIGSLIGDFTSIDQDISDIFTYGFCFRKWRYR